MTQEEFNKREKTAIVFIEIVGGIIILGILIFLFS